jgi:hypothetical protein
MQFLTSIIAIDPYLETIDPLNDPNKVYYSPGVLGFFAVFLMMLAATFLIIDRKFPHPNVTPTRSTRHSEWKIAKV